MPSSTDREECTRKNAARYPPPAAAWTLFMGMRPASWGSVHLTFRHEHLRRAQPCPCTRECLTDLLRLNETGVRLQIHRDLGTLQPEGVPIPVSAASAAELVWSTRGVPGPARADGPYPSFPGRSFRDRKGPCGPDCLRTDSGHLPALRGNALGQPCSLCRHHVLLCDRCGAAEQSAAAICEQATGLRALQPPPAPLLSRTGSPRSPCFTTGMSAHARVPAVCRRVFSFDRSHPCFSSLCGASSPLCVSPAFGCGGAFAQTNSSVVHGSVADPTGAKLPNATVVLLNPVSGFTRTTTTGSSGDFNSITFPSMPTPSRRRPRGSHPVGPTSMSSRAFLYPLTFDWQS